MIDAIHSEFRKLLTVRSTYFITLISLLIVAFFAGFIEGVRASQSNLHNPHLLTSESYSAIVFVGLILAFAGLLLMGHEYRYNTITYSLTSSNRRYKNLIAKFVVISVFAVVTGAIMALFSPLCTIVGLHLHGLKLVPQTFNYWNVLWQCAYVAWGYAMLAFILITIIRSQVGAIITFLLVPLIGENILSVLLKDNSKYLPFTSLQTLVGQSVVKASATECVTISLTYIVIGLLIGSVLFTKRDAN